MQNEHKTLTQNPALEPEVFQKSRFDDFFEKHILSNAEFIVQISTVFTLIISAFIFYELKDIYFKLFTAQFDTTWGFVLLALSTFLLTYKIGYFSYIMYLFFRYKPIESVSDEQLPTCTVIVPAYNEGKQVWETLHSLAQSNYPEEKLQLFAIDDGSKDDTWDWIVKAKVDLGDRLTIFKQPENKGKRHALYRGFNDATGEIFVTVDSDSMVKKDTLRNLVSPFVVNEKCGAVAGNVKVLNTEDAIIPKMLNVSFAYSFEFIRAAQSMLGSVLCTPGALAAYKRESVMACLPEWINQTFMGKPTDIGEDRAMTNMILKQGYHVLFQKNAHVLTNIPENYTNLHKMFTRWERSNVRENIMMSKFAFKKFRSGSLFGTRLILINQWVRVLMAIPAICFMVIFFLTNPTLYVATKLSGILIFSCIPAFYYAYNYSKFESIWAYTYSIFYVFALFWITPFALVTAKRSGWLTREIQTPKTNI